MTDALTTAEDRLFDSYGIPARTRPCSSPTRSS
jgi:hypothetical protein